MKVEEYTYDELNRVIQVDYLDREGEPVKMLDGYAAITYTYYSNGRLHTIRYFGATPSPAKLMISSAVASRAGAWGAWTASGAVPYGYSSAASSLPSSSVKCRR